MGDELEKGKEKVEKMEVEEMTGKEKVVMEKKEDLYEYIRENVTEKDELEYYLNFMKTTYTFTKTKQKSRQRLYKRFRVKEM